MGYFSNGSEGDYYEGEYCSRCLNNRLHEGDEFPECSVLELHLLYNYDQFGTVEPAPTIKAMLGQLIPTSTKGGNLECRMFLKRGEK